MKETIDRGTLKRTIVLDEEYEMHFLDESNIDEIVDLQNEVASCLKNPETFAMDSREFILNEVLHKDKGRAIGVFAHNRLIAFRTVSFPGMSQSNMGRELGLSEGELEHVVHLEATVVHPEYRGNKLQAKMMKHTFNIVYRMGYYHVLCTVSPFNYPSLKNVIDGGLVIKALGQREGPYNGKWRFLLHRDLRYTATKEYRCSIEVENEKLHKQKEILNKGYEGFLISRSRYMNDEFMIHYGIPYENDMKCDNRLS
ncbi:GNAT family N-acetyltransferase [Lutispora thermophila]|uniref:Acetyltransferase (GNAT) family n=1 Tax=Lutispora thermophila DSM 19022 TaxID=1122184 RepID=A0A1M6GUV5_9FIRM|nr:GNAT family N-acetyltransferase [Lutispora thermophila]SHJ13675.1 Acetyltransferase (GNAT) family [Lutispora thermophila DSM 19022]